MHQCESVSLVYLPTQSSVKSTFPCKSIHDGWLRVIWGTFLIWVLWFQVEPETVRIDRWDFLRKQSDVKPQKESLAFVPFSFPTWDARNGNSRFTSEKSFPAWRFFVDVSLDGSERKRNQKRVSELNSFHLIHRVTWCRTFQSVIFFYAHMVPTAQSAHLFPRRVNFLSLFL